MAGAVACDFAPLKVIASESSLGTRRASFCWDVSVAQAIRRNDAHRNLPDGLLSPFLARRIGMRRSTMIRTTRLLLATIFALTVNFKVDE